jgi:hypothetical protein
MLRGRKRETASANLCVAIVREPEPSPEFTALIEPHAPDVFLRDAWEKSPLVIRRGQPDRYQSLLSLTSIDTLISLLGPNPGRKEIRLVRCRRGKLIEKSVQTTASGYADAYWLYAAYHEGYTIVLNGIDRRWPPIALLCRRLETELRHNVGANVYFTPARSQGFLPHFDGHDVFILQVEGAKCWRVFRAMADLPLENTPSDFDPKDLGKPEHEFLLEPGDLLYIPRGFVHSAATSAGSSIHITLGIHPVRWVDVMIGAVRRAAESDIALRAAFSADGSASPEALTNHLQGLLGKIANGDLCREVVRHRLATASEGANPPPDGHFRSLDRVRKIRLDTGLSRRGGIPSVVAVENNRAVIRFTGNSISGPKSILPALRFVDRADFFTVRDLPDDLSNGSKLVLASRLVREGLFSVS